MDGSRDEALEQLRREASPEDLQAIRELWKAHSKAEDARDLEGLVATLTPDCVYRLPQAGREWRGHEGARAFYTELLSAFPDLVFHLQHIVVGSQGVFEVARAQGTHRGPWMGRGPTGAAVSFTVFILFPWDPRRRRFLGEIIWTDPAPAE